MFLRAAGWGWLFCSDAPSVSETAASCFERWSFLWVIKLFWYLNEDLQPFVDLTKQIEILYLTNLWSKVHIWDTVYSILLDEWFYHIILWQWKQIGISPNLTIICVWISGGTSLKKLSGNFFSFWLKIIVMKFFIGEFFPSLCFHSLLHVRHIQPKSPKV